MRLLMALININHSYRRTYSALLALLVKYTYLHLFNFKMMRSVNSLNHLCGPDVGALKGQESKMI